MGAPVAADRDALGAFLAGEGGIGPAEGVGVRFGQRVSDYTANVIFAQDGGVEAMGHGRAHTRIRAAIQWEIRRPSARPRQPTECRARQSSRAAPAAR